MAKTAQKAEAGARKDGILVDFVYEKETPGTYRFRELGDRENHKIGTLYIKKRAFSGGRAPKGLKVVVEAMV